MKPKTIYSDWYRIDETFSVRFEDRGQPFYIYAAWQPFKPAIGDVIGRGKITGRMFNKIRYQFRIYLVDFFRECVTANHATSNTSGDQL